MRSTSSLGTRVRFYNRNHEISLMKEKKIARDNYIVNITARVRM